jgi:hypothetical protein
MDVRHQEEVRHASAARSEMMERWLLIGAAGAALIGALFWIRKGKSAA